MLKSRPRSSGETSQARSDMGRLCEAVVYDCIAKFLTTASVILLPPNRTHTLTGEFSQQDGWIIRRHCESFEMKFFFFSMGLTAALVIQACAQVSAVEPAQKIFLIGNSLTWDTVPSRFEQNVQWHVDCGKSLKEIYEHPENPCVGSSTLWPEALKTKQYDLISVQPHYGTTVKEDLAVISQWIALQPHAVFIIHTGWARQATLLEEYWEGKAPETLTHSPAYFESLLTNLREQHPNTEFRTTHAMRLLIELDAGIQQKMVPLKNITEVYRDAIHMNVQTGRYLMHNALRETLGQERTEEGFEQIPADLRAAFNRLLDQRRAWPGAVPQQKEQPE